MSSSHWWELQVLVVVQLGLNSRNGRYLGCRDHSAVINIWPV